MRIKMTTYRLHHEDSVTQYKTKVSLPQKMVVSYCYKMNGKIIKQKEPILKKCNEQNP